MKKKTARQLSRLCLFGLLLSNLSGPLTIYAAQSALIDGETAARLLLDNRQEELVDREPTMESTAEFPEKFDLRELGVVTPVKFQNPWGTCWGFSAIAAAETSILSEMGKTYEETGLDLSEHHMTYFARSHMQDGSSQDGEGIYMLDDEANTLNTGGEMFTATSLFSSGIGVVDEETIPYRGKNSLTDHYSFPYDYYNYAYSAEDDWTIPDEYKFMQKYELEHSELLDSPAIYEPSFDVVFNDNISERNAAYIGYDQAATDRVKQALMDGYAISIAYAADTYSPDQLGTGAEPEYMNVEDNKWTHYTYDAGFATHAVTVVGWDDTIKSTDFLDHTDDAYGDGLPHQPEGDGAWIVKNSWGSLLDEFPNRMDWGIEDENGDSTGYFYLSYYDRSVCMLEIFDFDVTDSSTSGYIIDQFDYLQSNRTSGWLDPNERKTANVFTAEYDEILRGLSCETGMKNTEVSYDVFLLDEDAVTPTDGEHVLTATETYELPGYHRLDLETEKQIEIAKGQRYAVILTQKTSYNGEAHYAVSTTTGKNEQAVKEKNRRLKAEHREDSFETYYSVGVVNPGESFVYFAETDAWSDFAGVIPGLQTHEDFKDLTFDNFPIKAYLDFKNEADRAAADAESLPPLDYAAPAGKYDVGILARYAAIGLVAMIFVIIFFVLLIKNIRKSGIIKRQRAQLEAAAADKTKLQETTEALNNDEAASNFSEN